MGNREPSNGLCLRVAESIAPASAPQFLALLWKEARTSRGFGVLAFLYCAFGVISEFFYEAPLGAIYCFAIGCGAATFRSEQKNQLVMFLSERGVTPRLVWTAKQVFWGSVLIAFCAAVLPPALMPGNSEATWEPIRHTHRFAILHGVMLVETAYFVAQLCSLCFRIRIVGTIVAFILGLLILNWTALLVEAEVDPAFGLAPLALAAGGVTLVHIRDWMNWRRGVRQYVIVAGTIVVGCIGCWALPDACEHLRSAVDTSNANSFAFTDQRLTTTTVCGIRAACECRV